MVLPNKPQQVAVTPTCVECGAPMREHMRWQQNDTLYVWYACTRRHCTVRFLERTPLGDELALPAIRRVSVGALMR